ncbi:MAG: LptF/LptG family permease [candidate division Zixibacteria bacterium]|nr:LptF/LptG family permease [candidate division Zixibacteria bacterium]MDH3938078.1 LptF/LptG family permease [candidate division Zixibacteria bacterium]MDH4035265.1 LptF/LptG family permease [candidate division Zixibacteria bacterium]
MKILTRYILKEHFAPFFLAFFTITFLLIIDLVPKIIDHVIDKDLPVAVVFEIIGLNLAWMLALSVPMSVLVATLMAFGRLTSDFEITAIKASGINLLRILVPLLAAGAVLMFGMIEFNDRILPDLNKRSRLLWADISAMRPTLVFRSGVFITDIPGYLVLIDKIDHSTSRVETVNITDTRDKTKPQIIVAEYGYLEMTDYGKNMRFTLYNGEVHSLDTKDPNEYRRVSFERYVKNVADVSSELVRTDSDYRNDREMSITDMQSRVDAAITATGPFRERMRAALDARIGTVLSDTLPSDSTKPLSDSAAMDQVRRDATALARQTDRGYQQLASQQKIANKYQIEIYKKYSIPAASLAFVLLGAPLGILTRRGGMGVAIAISIVLFIVYWAFLIGGEDLADRGLMSPFWAMWIANFLMGGLGIYLIYIVATEKPMLAFFRRKR